MDKDIRKDSRYKATDPGLVTVSVRRTAADDESDVQGVLMDLSRGGLRLRVDESLPKGAAVNLTLAATEAGVEICSAATVRWAEPAYPTGWIVGCSLDSRIDESSLDELASCGALERRLDARRPISFCVEAKTELDQTYKPVQIVNLSAGGFCAMGHGIGAQLHDRLLVKISNDGKAANLVKSRVAWVNESDDGQTFGCTFLSRDGRALMQAMFSEEESSNPLFEMAATKSGATRWALVAVFVIFIAIAQYFAK